MISFECQECNKPTHLKKGYGVFIKGSTNIIKIVCNYFSMEYYKDNPQDRFTNYIKCGVWNFDR